MERIPTLNEYKMSGVLSRDDVAARIAPRKYRVSLAQPFAGPVSKDLSELFYKLGSGHRASPPASKPYLNGNFVIAAIRVFSFFAAALLNPA